MKPHTPKNATSICYHTKLSISTQKCEKGSQHFYRNKMPTSVWNHTYKVLCGVFIIPKNPLFVKCPNKIIA